MDETPASDTLHILTFNHHESYLCALAGLPATFDVVTRRGSLDLGWNIRARAVPANMRLIDFDKAYDKLRHKSYDAIVCHTIKNLFWLLPYQRKRLVFVAHIPLFRSSFSARVKSFLKRCIVRFWQIFFDLEVIAVSEFKRASWNLNVPVAKFFPVAFPKDLLSEKKSEDVHGVFVGNLIKERGLELGWPMLEKLLPRIPLKVIGQNPGIRDAFVPKNFSDFVREFSKAHFYVYAVDSTQGDGYNTASLEAMLLGLPTVTLANPSSPIIHGVNGLIAKNLDEFITSANALIADQDLRERLGNAARETVLKEFSAENFLAVWWSVLQKFVTRQGDRT